MTTLRVTKMERNRGMALGLAALMLIHTTSGAFAAAAPAATAAFMQDVKALQSSIDSGKVAPADAIDQFSQSIVDKNITLEEVNAFAKTQMTDKQYAAFQSKMSASMRGINPTELTSAELGQIVGQALADLRTEGLYWDGCAKAWTGAALIAAAVIVAVMSVGKNKSNSQVQSDYQNQIASSQAAYNQSISDTQNWETAYPQRIHSYQNDVAYQQGRISEMQNQRDYYELKLILANTASDKDYYSRQISSLNSDINYAQGVISSDQSMIINLQTKMIHYTANPAQATADAQALALSRDARTAQLQAEEAAAIADAPANRSLARKMGVGAGLGAAIGAGLIVTNDRAGCFF